MDAPLGAQLALGGIPQLVVGLRGLELLEGVGVRARIRRVLLERLQRPGGQRVDAIMMALAL